MGQLYAREVSANDMTAINIDFKVKFALPNMPQVCDDKFVV